jgi:hypothetical protein
MNKEVIRGEVIEDEKEIFVVDCFKKKKKKQKRTEKSKKKGQRDVSLGRIFNHIKIFDWYVQ